MIREIPLSQSYTALVDEEDWERLKAYGWYAYTRGRNRAVYVVANRKTGSTLYIHRLIMGAKEGEIVDHIDGNGLNNTKANLRVVTSSQNLMNSQKPCTGVTSKYKGVCFISGTPPHWKTWRAELRLNQKGIWLGCFHTEVEAAEAYNKAAIKYFGEYARLNAIEKLPGNKGVLTILIGPIGSGKSTYCSTQAKNQTRISQDEQGKRGHWERFIQALKSNDPAIIIDRMSFSKEQRRRYAEVARAHGYRIKIVVLGAVADEELLLRVVSRVGHPTIKHGDTKTAQKVISFFRDKYEPPTPDEYDELEYVR